MKVGIVGFSFARGEYEPNICNMRLAHEVRYAMVCPHCEEEPVVVTQWEITTAINKLQLDVWVRRSVERELHGYLDSERVAKEAAELFHEKGVTDVIVIAQPFLHMHKCKRLMRKHGFNVLDYKVARVGFLKGSRQWWARGPCRTFLYAALQLVGVRIR